jgi:hypothetical protein
VRDCRILAETRRSCPRRTTFLRFCGGGVEPELVALPVGLRFYVFAAEGLSRISLPCRSDYDSTFSGGERQADEEPSAPEERELLAAVPASWQAGGNNDRGQRKRGLTERPGERHGRCRFSGPNHRSAVACQGNNSRGLRRLDEQSKAQLEKGHCAINVQLQARIEALLGRWGRCQRARARFAASGAAARG